MCTIPLTEPIYNNINNLKTLQLYLNLGERLYVCCDFTVHVCCENMRFLQLADFWKRFFCFCMNNIGVHFHSLLSKFPGKQQIREQLIKHNYTSSQSTTTFKTLLSHWPAKISPVTGGSRKYVLGWQRGGMGSVRGGNTKASPHA